MLHRCTIPAGCSSGQLLTWTAPSGKKVNIKIPAGMGAGQVLEFQVPESVSKPAAKAPEKSTPAAADGTARMEVKVPSSWAPGQKLAVTTPSGAKVMVTPPANATVGMTVAFSVPREALVAAPAAAPASAGDPSSAEASEQVVAATADFMMSRLSLDAASQDADDDSARHDGETRESPASSIDSEAGVGMLPNLPRRVSAARSVAWCGHEPELMLQGVGDALSAFSPRLHRAHRLHHSQAQQPHQRTSGMHHKLTHTRAHFPTRRWTGGECRRRRRMRWACRRAASSADHGASPGASACDAPSREEVYQPGW